MGTGKPSKALPSKALPTAVSTTTPQKTLKKQKVGDEGKGRDQPVEEAEEMNDYSPSSHAPQSPHSPLQPKEIFPAVEQDAQTQSCHKTPPWNKSSPFHAEGSEDIGSKQCQVHC